MFAFEKRMALALFIPFFCQPDAAHAVMPESALKPTATTPAAKPAPTPAAPTAPGSAPATPANPDGSITAEPAVDVKPKAPSLRYSPLVQGLINRGLAYERAGDLQVADKNYRLAYKQAMTSNVAEGQQVLTIFERLRDINIKLKKNADAIAYMQRVVDTRTRVYGNKSILVAKDLRNLADMQFALGKTDEAKGTYLQAIATANGAPASGYSTVKRGADAATVAAAASTNLTAKRNLVLACYDGLTKCLDKNDDPGSGEDAYTSAINQAARVKDKEFPTISVQSFLVKKYHDYLSSIQRPDDAADLDKQFDETFRRQEANRTYDKGSLPDG